MNMYTTPVDGLYNHKTPRYDGTFDVQQVSVMVLGESAKMYLVRLRLPVGNRRQGDELQVRKRNVRLRRPKAEPREYDYSGAWWNN